MSRHRKQQVKRQHRSIRQADPSTVDQIVSRFDNTGRLPGWSGNPEYATERAAAVKIIRRDFINVP